MININSAMDAALEPIIDISPRWEVMLIRGHTYIKKRLYYLVMWKGCPMQDTWEPWNNLEWCKDSVDQYHEAVGHIPPRTSDDEKCSGCQRFTHITNFV